MKVAVVSQWIVVKALSVLVAVLGQAAQKGHRKANAVEQLVEIARSFLFIYRKPFGFLLPVRKVDRGSS